MMRGLSYEAVPCFIEDWKILLTPMSACDWTILMYASNTSDI